MPVTHRRLSTRLALAALAAAAALRCSCPPATSTQPPAPPIALPGTPGADTAPPPPEPEKLEPLIEPTGAPGVLPSGVVINFSRPVAGDDQVRRPAGEKTAIRMEPAVRGAWVFTDQSTLTFRPQEPFAFDTTYTVILDAVESASGVIQAPKPDAWKGQFTTPRYAFLRMSPQDIDLRGGKVTVDLVFSGPVDVPVLRRMASFTANGQPISDVKMSSPDARHVARVTLSSRAFKPGSALKLALRAGTTSAGYRPQIAPAAEASFSLFGGRKTKIYASNLREGPTGYFVEVFCQDDKREPGEAADRSSQDEEGESYGGEDDEGGYEWWRYQPGCMLQDSEAADGIHFTPEVKFSIAPSRGGFRLFGDFKRGSYTLRIDAGVGTVGGGMLYSTFERQLTVGARTPKVGFASSGRYLPRSAWRSLAITHLNVDTVQLSVRHVRPENLIFWLSDSDERGTERNSDLLLERAVKVKGEADTQTTTWVDVGSLVPSTTKGVVEVGVRDPYSNSTASSRLLLTEMSLVAKKAQLQPGQRAGTEEVWVWALGIDSLEALSGVEVSLVRRSGKVVGRCTTAGADGCKLKMAADDPDPAQPFALVARKGDDLTYLRYEDLRTDTTDSDTAGEPYASEVAYRASLYTDRGVYRPGDTAHLVAVLRDRDNVAPAADLPAQLEITDPRGRLSRKLTLKTNEAGLLTLDLPFASFADTGRYDVELKVADRVAGRHSLLVEEFVPERMKVTVSPERPAYALGATVPLLVEARYLFGGSAADSPVEVSCRLEPSAFKPKENASYTYGVWVRPGAEIKPLTLGQVKGRLDEKGQAALRCPSDVSAGFKGPARLVAQAAVFEAGSGRATQNEAAVPVHPEAYYLGLAAGAQKVEAGKGFQVSGVVVDWNGALAPDAVKQVEVELSRLEEEYSWSWDEASQEERYQRWLRPVREGRSTVNVQGGKFTVSATPSQNSAGYLVRVKAGGAQTDLQLEGSGRYYWYSNESRVEQTPKPMKPTSLSLSAPELVKVGDQVKVSFKAPYAGRALLTAETNQVLAARWQAVTAGENTWTFPLEKFAPNVYVSAFLVKDPHLESKEAFTPDRAFGVTSVTVEPTEFTQKVELKVPGEVRSSSALEVELDLGGGPDAPTYATVAAVDEGILQLTRFKSPNPLETLFARRALGVETYETVGWTLLVPPQGPQTQTGGDEGGGEAGRVQPVKPVALWSGLVKVGADGKAKVTFQVPQYRGALRVMAVTTSAKRIGRASATVLVRDPIVLSTTLPRFLSMGDEIQIPVFVTNLSGGPLDVKVQLTAEDLPEPGTLAVEPQPSPLELLGKPEGTLKLASEKAGTLVFQARAVKATGAARLRVTARGGGHESREELDVPFLPSGPKERLVQRIELAEGTTDLKPFLQGWLANSEQSTIWVTNNPYGESFDHLKHLVQYPYGCIEQTTSSTRPLLFVSNLIESVDPGLVARGGVDDMVMSGINRVFSMQTAAGGFGYWPGDTRPVGWGTAYATHMLIDAEKLGYPVPEDRLKDALAWIGQEATRLENMQRERTDEDGDGDSYRWEDAHDAEPYLHLVLAMKGQGRKARVQRLIDTLPKKKDGPAVEKEFMLKAALYLAGDRRYEKDLKNPDASPVTAERLNRWDFYSDARRRGLMLSTFQDLFGNDPAGEALAQRVADHLKGRPSGWYTTQELVWSVTGLGKRLQGMNKAFQPAELAANGKGLKPNPPRAAAGKGKAAVATSDRTWAIPRASQLGALTLSMKDKGEGKVFALISSEGVRENSDFRVGGEGLRIQRRWRTLEGDEVALQGGGSGTKLADLLYVEVEISNTSGGPVQNIALVDRLPAGFEIENPRLGRGAPVSWLDRDSLWEAEYMNVRDDRIELFGALDRGQTKKVVYAVRVVTSGKFTIPPVEAEAMYDPRIWAREAGGTVEVAGPWKDFLL
jgi:hypothetical protein